MTNNFRIAVCLLAGIVLAQAGFSQDDQTKAAAPQPHFFRLEFVVKELENDKVINSRLYVTSLAANAREREGAASIRTGSRVPYVTSTLNPGVGAPVSKQFNFYELGVNIDSRDARELASGQLTLAVQVDISSVVIGKESTGDLPPVVRTTRWSSPVIVPIKRATTIFSSDDPSGNRKMQLELTATPIL